MDASVMNITIAGTPCNITYINDTLIYCSTGERTVEPKSIQSYVLLIKDTYTAKEVRSITLTFDNEAGKMFEG